MVLAAVHILMEHWVQLVQLPPGLGKNSAHGKTKGYKYHPNLPAAALAPALCGKSLKARESHCKKKGFSRYINDSRVNVENCGITAPGWPAEFKRSASVLVSSEDFVLSCARFCKRMQVNDSQQGSALPKCNYTCSLI